MSSTTLSHPRPSALAQVQAPRRTAAGRVQDSGWTISLPHREIHLEGPGLIFKGNPRNYPRSISSWSPRNDLSVFLMGCRFFSLSCRFFS
jgi:hypothetical protein